MQQLFLSLFANNPEAFCFAAEEVASILQVAKFSKLDVRYDATTIEHRLLNKELGSTTITFAGELFGNDETVYYHQIVGMRFLLA